MQEARHWHAGAAVPANGRIYALGGWALEDAKVWGLAAPLTLFFLIPLFFLAHSHVVVERSSMKLFTSGTS